MSKRFEFVKAPQRSARTPFLKSDERIQVWQAMYDRTAQALTGEDMKRIMDRSATRTEA